eukprot:scaffold743_cov117-Cylindrotheca_fusiformis.AAC.16
MLQALTVDIDLTLQSVDGIVWHSEKGDTDVPVLRASVSFAGSPRNMQVSSFTMCGKTGNLVVESNHLEIKKAHDGKYPMFASFGEAKAEEFSRKQSTFSTTSTASSLPHVRLDSSVKSLGTASTASMSIEEANRESLFLPDGRLLLESNPGVEVAANGQADDSMLSMEQSLEWDMNSSDRPDVVDLNVSLRTEDNEIVKEGIAHLVLYGMQEDSGVTTLDLPLKEKQPNPKTVSNHSKKQVFSFSPQAFIRVQLTTISDTVPDLPGGATSGLSSSIKGSVEIGNLVERMHQHEAVQAAKAEEAKNTFQPVAPSMAPAQSPQSRFFCGAVPETFFDAFRCETKGQKSNDLRPAFTFDSTIITRESLFR